MRFLDLLRQTLGWSERQSPVRATTAPPPAPPPPFPAPATSFVVSDVPPATTLLPETAYRTAVELRLQPPPSPLSLEERRRLFDDGFGPAPPAAENVSPVEACSRYRGQLVADVYGHPFMAAVHAAFADHRPLVLSPDMLWLLLMQGFAHHVDANAEALRSRFVRHQGRISLSVRRDDFIKGSPENPWDEVFESFSSAVRQHLGAETHDLLLPSFSTTGELERAATQVVLLGAMRAYFDYALTTLCGIPRIALEGTPEDWEQLEHRARTLASFGLDWWIDTLLRVLREFSSAARGTVHQAFWRSMYKENDQSGGPYVTGWVSVFFPYLSDPESGQATMRNSWSDFRTWWHSAPAPEDSRARFGDGPSLDLLPSGLSRVPFRWQYLDRSFAMEFVAGFTGIRQDRETLALRPEIGWAVREAAPA